MENAFCGITRCSSNQAGDQYKAIAGYRAKRWPSVLSAAC
jgi:hypothetical protein